MNGILFTQENIKLTIEGKKTQTRRTAGLKEINKEPDAWEYQQWIYPLTQKIHPDLSYFQKNNTDADIHLVVKPRYHPGEVVYIKQTYIVIDFILADIESELQHVKIEYMDGTQVWVKKPKENKTKFTIPDKIHSAMFMPAWAARYFIKILSVRPERLRDITPEDCIAEGLKSYLREYDACVDLKEQYFALWDSINGKNSHKKNPLVWVYEYKLCDRPENI